MFKFAHKISSYGDESRVDFNLSKRKRNFLFKDKVLYLKDQAILLVEDQTVLWKDDNRYWCKFLYVMNNKIIYDNKKKQFVFKNNILHRENGPAIIYSNYGKEWYFNGKRHRDSGLPAVIYSNGYHEYWRNGVQYTP